MFDNKFLQQEHIGVKLLLPIELKLRLLEAELERLPPNRRCN